MHISAPLGASIVGAAIGGVTVMLALLDCGGGVCGDAAGASGEPALREVSQLRAVNLPPQVPSEGGGDGKTETCDQPEESPDVAAWIAAGTPGKAHKKLDTLAGAWKAHMVLWPDHEEQRVEAWGRVTRQWVLGGRFMQAEFEAKVQDDLYRGIGYFGYDNIRDEYTVLWMDDRSTSTQLEGGGFEDDSLLVTHGTYEDPATGNQIGTRHDLRFVSDDRHVLESFMIDATGEATRTVKITYTRRP